MDEGQKQILPQGGTVGSGESPLLGNARSCSIGSGGCTQVLAKEKRKEGVADHAATPKTPKVAVGADPFGRSASTPRTPPEVVKTPVVAHVETIDMECTTEEEKKRKRGGGNSADSDDNDSDGTPGDPAGGFGLEMTVMTIIDKIAELNAAVGAQAARGEICKITEALLTIANELGHLAGKSFRDKVTQDLSFSQRPKQRKTSAQETCQTCQTRAESVKKTAAQTKTKTCDAGTQTTVWNHGAEVATVGSTKDINSFADFKAVADLKWDQAAFKNVSVKVGNPLNTPHSTVKCVLVDPGDPDMTFSIQRMFRDRAPELSGMKEELGVIEQITRKRSPEGGWVESSQKIVKIHHDGSDHSVWERLQALREETRGDSAIAIHHILSMSEDRLKKMVESVFRGDTPPVTIFTTKERKDKERAFISKKERTTMAISVSGEGRTFKDILKGVREAVKDKPGSESIQSLRSTREDQLLIVLNKDEMARGQVVKLLEAQKLKVRQVGPRTKPEVLHLRGLDELASREEVTKAIEQAVGPDDTTKVGALRPHWHNTQAATLTLSKDNADKLVGVGHLRVGPSRCPVERRLEVKRCSRCWSFEHAAGKCTGPDRSKHCMGCGQEGHAMKNCKADKSCVLCNGENHALGSGRCKAFRHALAMARKQNNTRLREGTKQTGRDPFPPLPSSK
jgi:hypothetical protein